MFPPVPLLVNVKGRGADNWVDIKDPGSELGQHITSIVSQRREGRICCKTDTFFAASLGSVGEIFLPGDARTVVAVHVRENKVGVPYAIGCEDIARGHHHEIEGCMIPSE